MQQKILTVAVNPAVDLSTRVERMLANRKLRCAGAHVEPGGGGINVSRVIRGLRWQEHGVCCARRPDRADPARVDGAGRARCPRIPIAQETART
jgi:6-phosphofructokinase 2